MAANPLVNGNVRWATFVLALVVSLVGVVLYVARVEAAAEANRIAIVRVTAEHERSVELLKLIQRRQRYTMHHLGIKEEDIPK